jgi:hypothetical protein
MFFKKYFLLGFGFGLFCKAKLKCGASMRRHRTGDAVP